MITKALLRKHFIELRNGFDDSYRTQADNRIFKLLIELPEFKSAEQILIYVSVDNEVDTRKIIEYSLNNGKNVAVPYCRQKEMIFYHIESFDDLTCHQFNIPAVNPEKAETAVISSATLCVVPALSFDKAGNRLGYGGGYYDRFLSSNKVNSIGLCREKSICESLPTDEFDIKIKKIVTENVILNIKEV